jgi:hypothetical protein
MDRAFVLTLLHENEKLMERNEDLAKKVTKINLVLRADGVSLVALIGNHVMANCFWTLNGVILYYARKNGRNPSDECARFAEEVGTPANTNYFKLTSGWSNMIYTYDGFTIQTTGDHSHAFVDEKEGFDIIRQIQRHTNTTMVQLH